MKLLVFLFCVFGGYLLLSQAAETNSFDQENSPHFELNDGDDNSGAIQRGDKNFKCPFPFGAYSDPDDCSYYHICIGGMATRKKCKRNNKFDILRRTCLPNIIAICGNKNKKTTTEKPTGTTKGGIFTCPNFMGTYPHPEDCSKYYTCTFFIPSLKTCPENKLFDVARSSCHPANEVNCGDRNRPGHTTSNDVTESTTTEAITETETQTEDNSKESTGTTTSTEPPTPTPTPKDIISTEKQRETAPPDTDCDENDVDCIIDETGDPDDWFQCPEDVGSYPHPSSDKLFIFCMNWIPSVKKCGMDLIFSKEQATCVKVNFLTQLRKL